MTLFELNSLRLGTSGKDRLACKDFVDLALTAAQRLEYAARLARKTT